MAREQSVPFDQHMFSFPTLTSISLVIVSSATRNVYLERQELRRHICLVEGPGFLTSQLGFATKHLYIGQFRRSRPL
mgnify:CR=1 FL=1